MKKLAVLIFLIAISQVVEAKTILYVANSATNTPCSGLSGADVLFCNRLAGLGYEIRVINEVQVKDGTATWDEYANASDMIFLGSNSADMANKKKFTASFCGNISSKNKPLFLTSVSDQVTAPDTQGCAFYLGIVSFNFTDNKCSTRAFKVARTGLITEGLEFDENVTIYTSANAVKIYDITQGGWVTAECIPFNATIEFYPVLYTNDRNVFWGLDQPSGFTDITWNMFDLSVLQLLGDSVWTVNAFILPSIVTANQDFTIFSKVTQLGKNVSGIVNFTVGNLNGSLANLNGSWQSKAKLSMASQYSLNINAYSRSLRGQTSLPVTVGGIAVNITSGNFKPDTSYTVSAMMSGATSGSYRILDPINYTVLLSGTMLCSDGSCSAMVGSMPNTNSLILEVTTSAGGSIKTIFKDSLSTDKNVYRPGDVIKVDYFSNASIPSASLNIIRPDGQKETPSPLPLTMISENHWTKNYSLSTGSQNGTYSIEVKAPTGTYNKTVDVIAWTPFSYLNKNSFNVFENLILAVGITDSYSNTLDFSVSAEIIDPDGNKTFLGNSLIKGSNMQNFSYMIPKGFPSGTSTIKVRLNDTSNRSYETSLRFSTNVTLTEPSLFVSPSFISITTVPWNVIDETVTIENTAQIDATNIIKNVSGIEIFVSAPSSLAAKKKADVKLKINARGLSEGNYEGYVNFYSMVGDAQITVNMEIVGDISAQANEKYSELAPLEGNISKLENLWGNTTEAMSILEETKEILNRTIREYENGDYLSAKSSFEEAKAKFTSLETEINNIYGKMPDNSFIIWYFALGLIIVIITITFIKIKGRTKRQKVKKQEIPKEEPKKEEIFYEPKGGDYRTDYY